MNDLASEPESHKQERRLRMGIIATEFPPMVGGMEQHAFGLANTLAETDEICVFTHVRNAEAVKLCNFPIKPVLEGTVYADVKSLRSESVDLWLTLNAGYSVLANHLSTPVFAYCHGNDFLNPWIKLAWLDDIIFKRINRTPYLWRFTPLIANKLNSQRLFNGLSKSRAVFVNSHFTHKTLLKKFPKLKRPITVSNPGVNDHFFKKISQSNVNSQSSSNKTLRLLTIARLATSAPKKNVDNIIRAIATLEKEISINWQIAGDGNRREELEGLARSYGIDHCSCFLGNIPNSEIPKLLDESELFVLPSVASGHDVESFGIVYAEAAARGVPSLMSRMGGATDAVENGRTGIIIDGASPEDIADGIRHFWENCDQFNSDDIRTFADQFRWSNIATRMRQVIIDHLEA